MTILLALLQIVLVLLFAPLLVGIIRLCKARFQGRRGASPLVPYFALLSLLKKDMTITQHASWIFRFVPFATLGSALLLAALVPTFATGVIPVFADNIFLIAGIVSLGSFFLVLGGMDTASAFGNMGSSREASIAALLEPPLLLSLASLGVFAASWSLGGIVSFAALSPVTFVLIAFFSLAALFLVVLGENARYPVDNPATHLELTMVHEAMILEYSGPYLAMLEYASFVKLTALLLLFLNLLLPFGMLEISAVALDTLILSLALFFAKVFFGGFLIAFVESTIVKMRFYRMQEYGSLALVFAFLGLLAILLSFSL